MKRYLTSEQIKETYGIAINNGNSQYKKLKFKCPRCSDPKSLFLELQSERERIIRLFCEHCQLSESSFVDKGPLSEGAPNKNRIFWILRRLVKCLTDYKKELKEMISSGKLSKWAKDDAWLKHG